MWNIATEPRHNVGNNKEFTPNIDVKFPFPISSDNDQLEEDIMEFQQDEYDKRLDELHEKMGLIFRGDASEKLAEEIQKNMMGKAI